MYYVYEKKQKNKTVTLNTANKVIQSIIGFAGSEFGKSSKDVPELIKFWKVRQRQTKNNTALYTMQEHWKYIYSRIYDYWGNKK
jgi:hypothetical protein